MNNYRTDYSDPARKLREHAGALDAPELAAKYPPGSAAGDAVAAAVSAMKVAAAEIDAHQCSTVDELLPIPPRP